MGTIEQIETKTLIEKLNWRYATKRMNGQKVPQEKVDRILEAIRLTASSMGLQPYNVLVIENPEIRKQIQPIANGQTQIVDSSHLLVFCAWTNVTPERIDNYINLIASERGVSRESLNGFHSSITNYVNNRTPEAISVWTAKQTYIALGTALVTAATEEVDSTPMEGFNPEALDELLQLKEKGLHSVSLLPLGYRNKETDPLVSAKKVRRAHNDLFMHI